MCEIRTLTNIPLNIRKERKIGKFSANLTRMLKRETRTLVATCCLICLDAGVKTTKSGGNSKLPGNMAVPGGGPRSSERLDVDAK